MDQKPCLLGVTPGSGGEDAAPRLLRHWDRTNTDRGTPKTLPQSHKQMALDGQPRNAAGIDFQGSASGNRKGRPVSVASVVLRLHRLTQHLSLPDLPPILLPLGLAILQEALIKMQTLV